MHCTIFHPSFVRSIWICRQTSKIMSAQNGSTNNKQIDFAIIEFSTHHKKSHPETRGISSLRVCVSLSQHILMQKNEKRNNYFIHWLLIEMVMWFFLSFSGTLCIWLVDLWVFGEYFIHRSIDIQSTIVWLLPSNLLCGECDSELNFFFSFCWWQ